MTCAVEKEVYLIYRHSYLFVIMQIRKTVAPKELFKLLTKRQSVYSSYG